MRFVTVIIVLVVWALVAWGVASLARRKGRSVTAYTIASVIVGPVISLVLAFVLLVLPSRASERAGTPAPQP